MLFCLLTWSTHVVHSPSICKGSIKQANAVHGAAVQTWSQVTFTNFVGIHIGKMQALSATTAVHVQDAHFYQHLVYVSLVGTVAESAMPVIDLAS